MADDFFREDVAMSSEYLMLIYEFILGCFVLVEQESLLGLRLCTIGMFLRLLFELPFVSGARELLLSS